MKNLKLNFRIAILFLLIVPSEITIPVFAYDDYGASARAVGMGNAFTAISDDPGGILNNPAGLAWLDNIQFSLLYGRLSRFDLAVDDIPYIGIGSLVYPRWKNITLGLVAAQRGSWLQNTNVITNNAGVLALAGKVTSKLSMGGNLKYLFNSNGEEQSEFDLDLGLMQRVNDRFSLGVSATGLLQPDMGSQPLRTGLSLIPTRQLKFGLAYNILRGSNKTVLAFDTAFRDRKNSTKHGNLFSFGIEQSFKEENQSGIALRGGYTKGDEFGLAYSSYSFGFSARINKRTSFYQAEYAYQDYPFPGTTSLTGDHRLSFTIGLSIDRLRLSGKKENSSSPIEKYANGYEESNPITTRKESDTSFSEAITQLSEKLEEQQNSDILDTIWYDQKRVTNIFYDYDIREALKDVSAATGISIIVDESVRGMITLEFQDLPLEECLKRMLTPLGFTFKRMSGYYLVGKVDPNNPSFPLLSTAVLIRPNYLKAKDCIKLLSKFYEPFIQVNEEINVLAVTASPELIQRIREDLTKIDISPQQVMIEVLVTEFSQDARRSLGVGTSVIASKPNHTFSVIAPLADLVDTTLGLIFGRIGIPVGEWKADFTGSMQSLVREGKVKIRANPKIVTIQGQPASIFVGKDQYYSLLTGSVAYPYERLEVIKAGVSLNITPYISDNQEITIDVQPEVSDVVEASSATGLPVVNRRNVKTKVRVKDGETLVIGGLLQKNEREIRKKIPLLGDIPIIGYLFSHSDKVVEDSEVVVFITPHILIK